MDTLPVTRPSPLVEKDLYALAYCNGNTRLAGEALGRDKEAVRGSKQRHERRYAEICDEIEPERRQRLAAQVEDALAVTVEVVMEGVELVRGDLPDLPPKERHTAVRNVTVVAGVLGDKAALMRNRPTQVIRHEKVTTDELWAEFQSMFPGVVDAQVVEEGLNAETPELPTGVPGSSKEEDLNVA